MHAKKSKFINDDNVKNMKKRKRDLFAGKVRHNLFFDLQNGISGDMAVAALLSLENNSEDPAGAGKILHAQSEFLKDKLKRIKLGGYSIQCRREKRNGIWGTVFRVDIIDTEKKGRDYHRIKNLIIDSGLDTKEKRLSAAIFETIALAESKVHGIPPETVHFHEIGAVDSIVDIVSFSVLFNKRRVGKSTASPIHLGTGTTETMHGILPVPAPATLEIIKGLPVQGTKTPYELTTPTGASIVKTVVEEFGPLPGCMITNIGLGFGKRQGAGSGLNALRILEYTEISEELYTPSEMIVVIEVTIDDSTPEEIAYLQEDLFSRGALDVFITPVYMKKNRPAFNITVMSEPEKLETIARTILLKSSSFGLRYHYYFRKKLERQIKIIQTELGMMRVKVGLLNGRVVKIVPEYEDCRKAAQKEGLSINRVFEKVRIEAGKQLEEQ